MEPAKLAVPVVPANGTEGTTKILRPMGMLFRMNWPLRRKSLQPHQRSRLLTRKLLLCTAQPDDDLLHDLPIAPPSPPVPPVHCYWYWFNQSGGTETIHARTDHVKMSTCYGQSAVKRDRQSRRQAHRWIRYPRHLPPDGTETSPAPPPSRSRSYSAAEVRGLDRTESFSRLDRAKMRPADAPRTCPRRLEAPTAHGHRTVNHVSPVRSPTATPRYRTCDTAHSA
ncbi:hypothetical protein pipiens_015198 [Culex pipiens pipiens]|uniref:Uncharacterized protein n=1 Tax=Culex pipiens pipiens TaxID=38569 RepID=A0ABD1CRN8_CULPP